MRYGTKGSVRPDWCDKSTCAIEVKNYNVVKYTDNLINIVAKQAKERQTHLPSGMQQRVTIDVRGQKLTPEIKNKIIKGIENKSGGIIKKGQIVFKEN